MAYASRLGRARISASNPQAAGVCDRCGFVVQHADLSWQWDWRGASLENIRVLVCNRCLDNPQEQQRAIILPADPTPIVQPRTQDYFDASTDFHTTAAPTVYDPTTGIPVPSTTTFLNSDGSNATELPYGNPSDIDINAVQPLFEGVAYGVKLAPTSVSTLGGTVVTVTFASAHGLANNAQIVVQGLSNPNACGAYSITVTTATAFTYQTNAAIPAAALLTGSTLMETANIGLPLGYTQLGA